MHIVDWLILLVPLAGILFLALYSRRYVRGIADFLAAGRVAGRYVISVGDLQTMLAVFTLIALCEREYQSGMAIGFWSKLSVPLGIFMSLTGYILYRYRQTKSLSLGQFLETRYNRPLRVVAAAIRTFAEMMTNAIGPAVAARFFIYFMGFPLTVDFFGFQVSTFALVMLIVLSLAMLVIWPGGRISLLVTDAIQGLMGYPIFVIFTCFVLSEISWTADVAPVMLDRVKGESFINPMDIKALRDFNIFAIVVDLVGSIVNRGAWIGNDTSGAGRTAHEQKMAGILGAWRSGFAMLMMSLLSIFVITFMLSDRFADRAKNVRSDLSSKAASEIISDPGTRQELIAGLNAIPPARHTIGKDAPYSRAENPDIPYLATTRKVLEKAAAEEIARNEIAPDSPEAAMVKGKHSATFQKFRTLYYQMMAPTLLRRTLPVGLMGLFVLLMVMLMLSTDDSRIFNASSTLVQDVVMPFRKKPFEKNEHLLYLKLMSVAVCIFFFIASLFFAQNDYIAMFINIMCALWLGAAGPIMIGGLYTRWGTTTGAFCALFFGSGTSLLGLIFQKRWADTIYPYLQNRGYLGYFESAFESVNNAFSPIIVWQMNPDKFPINSYEIYFLSMILGFSSYIIGSLLTYRKAFNLDSMLHRGKYAEEGVQAPEPWTIRNAWGKLIGITPEYTKGDKVIAWSVFLYSVVYQFGIAFIGVLIWNAISPWPPEYWGYYFFFTVVIVGIVVGIVSTVWFMWGGIVDIRRLFKDLAARVDNPSDDGWVDKKE